MIAREDDVQSGVLKGCMEEAKTSSDDQACNRVKRINGIISVPRRCNGITARDN
jgi:hypothetical protein